MELPALVLKFAGMLNACFFCRVAAAVMNSRLQRFSLKLVTEITLPVHLAKGTHYCPVKYFCGGPRFPKTPMVGRF